jgi:hypothetical protein
VKWPPTPTMTFLRKHAFAIVSSLMLTAIVALEAVVTFPHGISPIYVSLDVLAGMTIGALSTNFEVGE